VARVSRLLVDSSISEAPEVYVRRHGTVIAEFGALTQDSGNVSWLVDVGDRRLFVKTAGTAAPPRPGAPVPFFDHEGRVRLLRNAIDIAASCRHPALARLLHVIESPEGPALVYEAAPGELVGVPRPGRHDPSSAYQRFAHLPAEQLLGVFDVLIDLHVALAEAGWVACDLYDGCLILDFSSTRLTVVDLDSYRRGPSVNDMGRMFGATRFMAPEEFELGAPLGEHTTTYTLGRLVWHFCTRLTERADDFCGPPSLIPVVQRACQPSPHDRPATVAEFAGEWMAARHRAGRRRPRARHRPR
jgi:serine/threonine protein kinase, bacterial